jgi:hypothetical protein
MLIREIPVIFHVAGVLAAFIHPPDTYLSKRLGLRSVTAWLHFEIF